MNIFRNLLVIAGISSAAIALFTIRSEYDAMMVQTDETQIFISAMQEEPVFASSLSYASQNAQMRSCDQQMNSVVGPLFGQTAMGNIASGCADRADEILATTPSLSIAHLVKANVFAQGGDTAAMIDAYQISHDAAPNEGWLATRRLRLALRVNPALFGDAARNDARTMIESNIYRPYLAEYYQSNPTQRDWITASVEGVDAKFLRSFLNLVRSSAAGGLAL